MISPHIARLLLKTEDHKVLIPYSAVIGALLAVLALNISNLFTGFSLPLNSTLGLLGAPFIVFFILRKKIGSYV